MFCRRSLRDQSLVEDVLQESVTRAYRDFVLFSEGTNFRAWIFRYVNLVLLETNRGQESRHQQSLEKEPVDEDEWKLAPDEDLLQVLLDSPGTVLEQCSDELNRAVLKLRPVDRSVLLLKSIGDFKYREIGEIIGIPLGTVMSSLARARQQVRHELAKKINVEGQPRSQTSDQNPKGDP
ncbi:MAG: sigma-70 family RNA polymerase sigma factor [Planctomycetota bacterium]